MHHRLSSGGTGQIRMTLKPYGGLIKMQATP